MVPARRVLEGWIIGLISGVILGFCAGVLAPGF